MTRWPVAVGALAAACSAKPATTTTTVDDARARAGSARTAAAGRDGGSAAAASRTGDVQVRVEWHDVPLAARARAGRTPCGTPRAAQVAPTTTWGIPDVFVWVDGAPPRADAAIARVVVERCAVVPRVAVGAALAIASAVEQPIELAIVHGLGDRASLTATPAGATLVVQLPIAGHAVDVRVDPGLATVGGTELEPSWIAVDPAAAISDAAGHAIVRGLAVGAHRATAWLPPRGGQPAREASAQVEIKAGALAELTIALAP